MIGVWQEHDEVRFGGLDPHQPAAGDFRSIKIALGHPADAFLFDFLPYYRSHGHSPFLALPLAGAYRVRTAHRRNSSLFYNAQP